MAELHPATAAILFHFEYSHLPPELQVVSAWFHELAHEVAKETSGAETTACLRKLLEAKDCAVRARRVEKRPEVETHG